jgi:hypothetical protein
MAGSQPLPPANENATGSFMPLGTQARRGIHDRDFSLLQVFQLLCRLCAPYSKLPRMVNGYIPPVPTPLDCQRRYHWAREDTTPIEVVLGCAHGEAEDVAHINPVLPEHRMLLQEDIPTFSKQPP